MLSFDYKINNNTRLKIEPYFQKLYDIPVIADSSFAVINLERGQGFNEIMVNEGTGTNMGIEFTLERFLNRGFYYLATASFYDSKYKGGDGVERNTLHNSNYVANILGGKEWNIGRNKNKIIGANARYYIIGGKRQSPVNYAQSNIEKEVVYDNTRLYEDQAPMTSRLDLTLSYKHNTPKYTGTLSIQMLNALGSVISYTQDYDFTQDQVTEVKSGDPFPNISYKIEF